jgi:hypothetical protein
MNATENMISRRSLFTTAGGVAVGLGISRLSGTAQAAEFLPLPPLPWGPTYFPVSGLDPDAVRKSAYCIYYKDGGCGHAAAQSIIDALGNALEAAGATDNPWKLLPRKLYSYAGGGVVGWGTICGSLNGAIGVMGMLGVHGKLGNALMDYYSTTALPTNALATYVPPAGIPVPLPSVVSNVANSPLCHNSMSLWAAAAGVPVTHPSNKDRCAKLVGDIVYRAVELINDSFVSAINPPAWVPPANYAGCYNCHIKPDMMPSQQGRMDCLECHDVAPAHGSWRKRKGGGG